MSGNGEATGEGGRVGRGAWGWADGSGSRAGDPASRRDARPSSVNENERERDYSRGDHSTELYGLLLPACE